MISICDECWWFTGKRRRLRGCATWADGFIWPSRRDLGRESLILFGDDGRCAERTLREVPGSAIVLDDRDGAHWLKKCLAEYRISIRAPGLSG